MRKLTYILFLVNILVFTISAHEKISVNETDSPKFVLDGSNYTVSSKITFHEHEHQVVLYLHTDVNTSLNEVELRGPSIDKLLRFDRVSEQSSIGKIYKIESNEFEVTDSKIGQVIFSLNSNNTDYAHVYVTQESPTDVFEIPEDEIRKIKIYKPSESAGKTVVLNTQSHISYRLNLSEFSGESILIEFWSFLKTDSSKFFEIKNNFGNAVTYLRRNEYGYLAGPSILDAEYFDEVYLDENSWNYFLIKLNLNREKIKIYCNNSLYFTGPLHNLLNSNSIELSFLNNSDKEILKIDRLKIWSFENNETLALSNKNYNHYNADSSSVLYFNNFDSQNSLDNLQKDGSIELTESDAPIFSRAPILHVSVYDQSFQLGWEINEFADAKSFTVEKSYDGKNFTSINTIQQIDENKTKFTTTDYDVSGNQVIFYRLKQTNQDDSEIYSSVVKVGRGKQTHFHVSQNYPNPFNPITTVAVDVKRSADFLVRVYDVVGNVITTLHNGPLGEGTHRFDFNGTDLPSGLYFCEVKSQDNLEVMKMILAK